jgi:hypothetical protein
MNLQPRSGLRGAVGNVRQSRPGVLIGVGLLIVAIILVSSVVTGMLTIDLPIPSLAEVTPKDQVVYGRLKGDVKSKDGTIVAKADEIFVLQPSMSTSCGDCYSVVIGDKKWDIPKTLFEIVDSGTPETEVSVQSEAMTGSPEVEAASFPTGMMLTLWVEYVDPAGAYIVKPGSMVQVVDRIDNNNTPVGMTKVIFYAKGINYTFNVFTRYLALPNSKPPSFDQPIPIPSPTNPPVGNLTPVELTIGDWLKEVTPLFSIERWKMARPWELFVIFSLGLLMFIFSMMDAAQNRIRVADSRVTENKPSWTGIIGTMLTPFVFVFPQGLPSMLAMGAVCLMCLRPKKTGFVDSPVIVIGVLAMVMTIIWQFTYISPIIADIVRVTSHLVVGPWLVLGFFVLLSHFLIDTDRSSLATLVSFQAFWILFTGHVPATNFVGSMTSGSLYVAELGSNSLLNIDDASRAFYALAFVSIWLRIWEQVVVRSDPRSPRQGGAFFRGLLYAALCTLFPVLSLAVPEINIWFMSIGISKVAAFLLLFVASVSVFGALIGTYVDETDESKLGDTVSFAGIVIAIDALALWFCAWATALVAFSALRLWFT